MVIIDVNRDCRLTEQAMELLKEYYMIEGEKSPQEAYARAAKAYSFNDEEFAQRIYDYASKGWFMFASPVLSNAPGGTTKTKAMPISCFLCHVPDSIKGLINHSSETRYLTIMGGGIGGHWSDVRGPCTKSPGTMPFIHTMDSDMVAYRQGKTRKGSYAAYMDISHPDIVEFIQMRIPTGDVNRKNLNIHHAVNLTDKFMECVNNGSVWDLIDPNTRLTTETTSARSLWELLLETRYRTGEPYLNFIDTANRSLPVELKNKGLKIRGSNLCNEIHLPTDETRSAVCCLSSVNLEYYYEWKDTNMIRDLIRLLDNVMQFFIDNVHEALANVKRGAEGDRPLGLGAAGEHSLYNKMEIDPESPQATLLNDEIFSWMKSEALKETQQLALERGEPPDMIGSGKRNSHLLAVAPNSNSAIILGCSPSIEPHKANAYVHRTRAGSHLIKNKYLEMHLTKLGINNSKTWDMIIQNNGSIQGLDVPMYLKNIFKTAIELDQETIIRHAAQRQKSICQGQSLNVFFKPGEDRKHIHDIHFLAWKLGCKGLYYLRTEASQEINVIQCKACEG